MIFYFYLSTPFPPHSLSITKLCLFLTSLVFLTSIPYFSTATFSVKVPNISHTISHINCFPKSQDIWISYSYKVCCTIFFFWGVLTIDNMSIKFSGFSLTLSQLVFFFSVIRASCYTRMSRFLLFLFIKSCSRARISGNTISHLGFSPSLRSPVFTACAFQVTGGVSHGLKDRLFSFSLSLSLFTHDFLISKPNSIFSF